jgi:hypothetical protein
MQKAVTIKKLPPASDEQSYIINLIMTGFHVIVTAIPGAGKTSLSLIMASLHPSKRFLMLTYNKSLKEEVRNKRVTYGLSNVQVHSYHSLAHNTYGRCTNDTEMDAILRSDARPIRLGSHIDVMVLDEAQDMTARHHEIVLKYLRDCVRTRPTILIIGDHHQGVYGRNGADTRYLTGGAIAFGLTNVRFASLSITYRLTPAMAFLASRASNDRPIISAKPDSGPVKLLRGNTYTSEFVNQIIREVIDLYEQGYRPGDIAFICPTTKSSKTPASNLMKSLQQECRRADIPLPVCVIGDGRDDCISAACRQQKLIVNNYQQTKGQEFAIVFLFGFDNYYPWHRTDIAPPSLFVAVSRASHKLYLIQSTTDKTGPPGFLTEKFIQNAICNGFLQIENIPFTPGKKRIFPPEYGVTNLLSNMTQGVSDLVSASVHNANFRPIDIPTVTKIKLPKEIPSSYPGLIEDVAAFNGIAIGTLYRAWKNNQPVLVCRRLVDEDFYDSLPSAAKLHYLTGVIPYDIKYQVWKDYMQLLMRELTILRDMLEVIRVEDFMNHDTLARQTIKVHLIQAMMINTLQGGYFHPLYQINRYDWLSPDKVQAMLYNINQGLDNPPGSDIQIEIPVYRSVSAYGTRIITGVIDIVTPTYIIELKCTDQLTMAHRAQLAIYTTMYKSCREKGRDQSDKKRRRGRLINALSGEVEEMTGCLTHADNIISTLLMAILDPSIFTKITDEEFYNQCRARLLRYSAPRSDRYYSVLLESLLDRPQSLSGSCRGNVDVSQVSQDDETPGQDYHAEQL